MAKQLNHRAKGEVMLHCHVHCMQQPLHRSGCRLLLLLTLLSVPACDLSVTNPGPVADEFLDERSAHPAIIGGASRALSSAINWIGFSNAAVTREITPSGGIGAFAYTVQIAAGQLDPEERNTEWNQAHRARWVAEDGVRRMRRVLGDEFSSYELGALGLLYAGYSNRLLGENMCQAVIDGGAPESHKVHFERAVTQFSEAAEIARRVDNREIELAALAGRASAQLFLGNLDEALADASAVPSDFVFQARYANTSQDEFNRFAEANQNAPWRSHSVWNTFYEQYYLDTNDPRTPWGRDPQFPLGDGRPVPWYFELKYGKNRVAPIDLSTGSEMRLIVAEVRLRQGDWQEALDIINDLRREVGVAPWETTGTEQTWTALKLERAIELWLEARLLGDFRRWNEENTPGPLPARFDMSGRSLCYPISESERATNPNVPAG